MPNNLYVFSHAVTTIKKVQAFRRNGVWHAVVVTNSAVVEATGPTRVDAIWAAKQKLITLLAA